ncbi:hypothetical protein C0992_006242 [Termitomyces sp. T32_za158]|nr:hypothetical protein C0992_006242 [Termitomyces sp. T32_za158]
MSLDIFGEIDDEHLKHLKLYGTPAAIPHWDRWHEISEEDHYRLMFKCAEEGAAGVLTEANNLYYYIGIYPNVGQFWKRTPVHGTMPSIGAATHIALTDCEMVDVTAAGGPTTPPRMESEPLPAATNIATEESVKTTEVGGAYIFSSLAMPVTPSSKKFCSSGGEPHVITPVLRLVDDLKTSDASALPVSKVPAPKTCTLASIWNQRKNKKVPVMNSDDEGDESQKIIDLEPEVVDNVAFSCGNTKEGVDNEMPDFIASDSDTVEIEESTSAQQISTVGALDRRKNKKVPIVNSDNKGDEPVSASQESGKCAFSMAHQVGNDDTDLDPCDPDEHVSETAVMQVAIQDPLMMPSYKGLLYLK